MKLHSAESTKYRVLKRSSLHIIRLKLCFAKMLLQTQGSTLCIVSYNHTMKPLAPADVPATGSICCFNFIVGETGKEEEEKGTCCLFLEVVNCV